MNPTQNHPSKLATRLLVIAALATLPVACIQPPTSSASVSDLRPGISFNASQSGDASVIVDGQTMGLVGDFLTGHGVLRVLPGTHQVKVVRGDAVLLDERVYLGDGVNRSFRVD
ncbi:MAG: hypothetical protein ACRBC3_12310 [Burkholderiaceae bacterium]